MTEYLPEKSLELLHEMDTLINWHLANRPDITSISMPRTWKGVPIHKITKYLQSKSLITENNQHYYYRSFEITFPGV